MFNRFIQMYPLLFAIFIYKHTGNLHVKGADFNIRKKIIEKFVTFLKKRGTFVLFLCLSQYGNDKGE